MDMQKLIALLITSVAVSYIGKRLYNSIRKRSCETGCGCGAAAMVVKKQPGK